MIKAALYIKEKLESGILTKAFHSDPVRFNGVYKYI